MGVAVSTHVSLLVRLRAAGDAAAWQEFHDRYADLIRGFARRQGLQPADCDDIVQEVLLRLSGALPGFAYDPARGKFRSYLKTIVVRTIATRFSQKTPASLVGQADSACAASSEAEDAVWEVEWRRYHVRRALQRIRAEFNSADLRAFEEYGIAGRAVAQVAEELGMSAAQIYQAKSVILRRLCSQVEQQVEEEG